MTRRIHLSEERQLVAALIFVTVAILGYVVGHSGSSAAPAESTREAANAVTLLNYSSASGWQSASGAPPVPGLSIAHPVVLAPNGNAAREGLIVGQMAGQSSPLPPQLLERLSQLPSGEVVDLLNTQAYRYSPLSIKGLGRIVTLFTIPNSTTVTTVLACYAPAGAASELGGCERLAATLSIATGRPQTEVRAYGVLAPDARYARRLRTAVARLDSLLLGLRPGIRPGASTATVVGLAQRLADGLARADAALSVPAPQAAERAHLALSASLRRARAAYSALGAAVSVGNASAYAAARAEVYAAEGALSTALRDFALLGYR
jgi:hypothetical protein